MVKTPSLLHARCECAAMVIDLRERRARQQESHCAQIEDGSEAQSVALCPPRRENNYQSSCDVCPILMALVSLLMSVKRQHCPHLDRKIAFEAEPYLTMELGLSLDSIFLCLSLPETGLTNVCYLL